LADRFFGLENLFSDLKRQRAADTNDADSGLADRGGNGGDGIAVRWHLTTIDIPLFAVHSQITDILPPESIFKEGCPGDEINKKPER